MKRCAAKLRSSELPLPRRSRAVRQCRAMQGPLAARIERDPGPFLYMLKMPRRAAASCGAHRSQRSQPCLREAVPIGPHE